MHSGCSGSRNSFVICLGQFTQEGGVGKGQRWSLGQSQRMGERDAGKIDLREARRSPTTAKSLRSAPLGQLWICGEFSTRLLRGEEAPENRGS